MRNPFAVDLKFELHARVDREDPFMLMCRYQRKHEALASCKQWALRNPDYECKLVEVTHLWHSYPNPEGKEVQ